ncbi:YqaJ viral recombinase family protein [Allohahella sp. A8]|uniref:YqaJ viral recombinase family protein n=1 Tax=Allohahella sp. A8 TaxID=3141461 RepID=UPI003A7FA3DE
MIFHDVEQNTDAWLALRVGRITSSNLSKLMAHEGKAFGEPAKQYAVNICIERAIGRPVGGGFSNSHMERGHEQEGLARALYEAETFSTVSNGGFFELDDIGCSPDGLVYDDGEVEIKSVIPAIHFANIKRQTIDPVYKWQIIGNVHFTQRDWIDSISYCADFPPDKQLYRCRVYREKTQDEFKRLMARIDEFRKLIDKTAKVIDSSQYTVEAA